MHSRHSFTIIAFLLCSRMAASITLTQYMYGYGACVGAHVAYGAYSNIAEEVEDIAEEVEDIEKGGVVEDVTSGIMIGFNILDLVAATPLYALERGYYGATFYCPLLVGGTFAYRNYGSFKSAEPKKEQ
mmetsp:Transcript_22791/g.42827  ORF Transcript_22791/g.42827 Transcript_22791/m.42827 type:complete len:129 (-) Transcript_22791:118-504(-)